MKRSIHGLLGLLTVVLLFANCRKAAFEEFYERPANLAPPMYEVLKSKGNFNTILAVIDKSGFRTALGAAGYWTFFAPNDDAFNKYFSQKGITLESLTAEDARRIVTYNLIYNAFDTLHIADAQTPTGWSPNIAFKRRTAYYDGYYTNAAKDSVFLSQNRNGSFVFGDDNNKYIPYFHSKFMNAQGLTANDYTYFFPNSTYTGFNVASASVITQNIPAENGIIHEVNEVVEPLPNVEQMLSADANYSGFKSIFERFRVQYLRDENATRRYNTMTGQNLSVYIKSYSNLLAYSLNNEAFTRIASEHEAQTDGYTLIAPNNAALNSYLNNVILEFYPSLADLPATIITDFLNAHMWVGTVWPSKFSATANFLNERPTLNPASATSGGNIVQSQFGSNGIFYGANKVNEANVFSTVYARAYLDPAYSIMTRLIDRQGRLLITNPNMPFTLFMIPDTKLRALGYDYNQSLSDFTFTSGTTVTRGAGVIADMLRILNLHILPFKQNDLSGNGIGETNQGEYIRWDNNRVYSAATIEGKFGLRVDPTKSRDYTNGTVHFLISEDATNANRTLTFSNRKVAQAIFDYAGTAAAPGPYFDFYEYLRFSTAYDNSAAEIAGLQLGSNYTVLIPTRDALKRAVVDGFLPGTTTGTGSAKQWASFTYNPASTTDKDLVARFIKYHILKDIAIAVDGQKASSPASLPTLLTNSLGAAVPVLIQNTGTRTGATLTATDVNLSPAANAISPKPYTGGASYSGIAQGSNVLGNRALIHLIDKYLKYNY